MEGQLSSVESDSEYGIPALVIQRKKHLEQYKIKSSSKKPLVTEPETETISQTVKKSQKFGKNGVTDFYRPNQPGNVDDSLS